MTNRLPEEHIFINDVTLRDGEQAPGNTMNVAEKVLIAKQLVRLGVNGIEAGFAIASPGDFEAIEAIASEAGRMPMERYSPYNVRVPRQAMYSRITSLARLHEKDIDAALRAVQDAPEHGIHTFMSTSQEQVVKFDGALTKRGGTPGNMRDFVDKLIVPDIVRSFTQINQTDPDAFIQFSPEDWTRTDEGVSDEVLIAAAANGADVINLPDTVGIAIPRIIFKRVAHVRELLNKHGFHHVRISWHGHNDTGQGVANAMEAMYGGARQFEPTILGIGERTGNFSFEGFLAALDANRGMHKEIMGVKLSDSIVRTETMPTAKLVSSTIGAPIPREHPIVGENAFAHESGIHQHGVIAGRESGKMVYEVLDPKKYGAESKLIIGKHSGWNGLADFMTQRKIPFRAQDRDAFTAALSIAADNRRKGLSDDEVLSDVIYPTIIALTGGERITQIETLEPENGHKRVALHHPDYRPTIGTATSPTEGRINAMVQAFKQKTGGGDIPQGGLVVRNVGEGSEKQAKASVTLHGGYTVTQTAMDEDTEKAIELAFLNAANALRALWRYHDMSTRP